MRTATNPTLQPGRVYRTSDLKQWGKNPSRLAKRLVKEGLLKPLRRGLFVHPRQSRFGAVPPDDRALLKRFLDGRFLLTGPDRWNALGLGTTAVAPVQLVYNEKRSGDFKFGGRRFKLRRVRFPQNPTPEWYAVDLLEHHEEAGASRETVLEALRRAAEANRLSREALRKAAEEYGTHRTQLDVEQALAAS